MDSLAVRNLITESEGLDDLEARLADRGIVFKSRKQLANFIGKNWTESYKKYLREDLLNLEIPAKLDDIPAKIVEVRGIDFHIHGISHSQGILEPFTNMSDRYIAFIQECAQRYNNLPDEDYLAEDNFSSIFGLDQKKSMRDIDLLYLDSTFTENIRFFGLASKLALITFLGSVTTKVRRKSDFERIRNQLYQDERYFTMSQQYFDVVGNLPQPLDIELQQYNGIFEKIYSGRSRLMAGILFEHAVDNNIKRMHAIVGTAHANQIVYFLKNYNN